MERARILVAEGAYNLPTVTSALAGFEVLTVGTMLEAKRLILENGIDVFIIGIHFSESRALELIQIIRTDEKHKLTPILVIRMLGSDYPAILKQSMNAMRALRVVTDYLELEGNNFSKIKEQIRECVDRNIPKDKLVKLSSPV